MPDILKGKPETILVVDDNESDLQICRGGSRTANFHVLSADNVANAIALAEQTAGRIDLLLSDVDMPLMSGPALGQWLKKTRPDLHVMLMSGGQTAIYWC
jgi:two-component system cell cycle sensor histidine kinase/response regulator CckA